MISANRNQEFLDFFNEILSLEIKIEDVKMITELDKQSNPKAVAIFSNCSKYNMEISIASNGHWSSSRQFIKECAYYSFITCNVERLTAIVSEDNAKSLEFCKRLGFEFEHHLKRWFGNINGIQMVMFKEKCRWI